MAAIQAPFSGLLTKLYADTTALSLATVSASELIGEVDNVGDFELTRNIIEYNSYGTNYKRKLVGQADSGTLDIQLSWVPDAATQPNQGLLKDHYDSGAKLFFAVMWTDASGNEAGATFAGFVASFSISQPVDDVVRASVQIAIDQDITMDLDGTFV